MGSTPAIPAVRPTVSEVANATAFNVLRALICLQIALMHFWPFDSNIFNYVYVGSESFFVLAGYFLAYGFRPGNPINLSMRSFLVRRIIRLAFPFWVSVIIAEGFFQLAHSVSPGIHDMPGLTQLWTSLLFLDGIYPCTFQYEMVPLWFMSPLIQFIFLWSIAFWLIRKYYIRQGTPGFHNRTIRALFGMTAVVYCLSVGCVILSKGFDIPLFQDWTLGYRAMFLCLGCFTYWSTGDDSSRGFFLACVIIACATGLALGYSQCFWAGIVAFLITKVVHWKGMANNLLLRTLAQIGVCSFSIYLTHMYAASIVRRFFVVFFNLGKDNPALMNLLVLTIQLFVTVALGAAFYYLIERPIARRSKDILYRKNEEAADLASTSVLSVTNRRSGVAIRSIHATSVS